SRWIFLDGIGLQLQTHGESKTESHSSSISSVVPTTQFVKNQAGGISIVRGEKASLGAAREFENVDFGDDKMFGKQRQLGPNPTPLHDRLNDNTCFVEDRREVVELKNKQGTISGNMSSNIEASSGNRDKN
ncbi:hypothetical protein Ancab_007666, partial [Ancistrocladus abbreviatus]